MDKWFYLVIFLICGAIFFAFPFLPDQKLHLVFCDVGQGDAILVNYKNKQVVIDGGPSGSKVLSCLSENVPFWDRQIEMMVLTHPDSDHVTGLIDVLEAYQVDQIVVNSVVKDSGVFWQFYRAVLAEKAKLYSPKAGDRLKLEPLEFQVLWPEERLGDSRIWENSDEEHPRGEAHLQSEILRHLGGGNSEDAFDILGTATVSDKANETSIVLKLSFGDFDALLAGDIGFDTEKLLDFPEVEVLKIPHHGSKYSTSQELLQEASPEMAVISVGKNSWGHPTEEVIEKVTHLGIGLLRTDQNGEIEIVSDGQGWKVK